MTKYGPKIYEYGVGLPPKYIAILFYEHKLLPIYGNIISMC
jgi:hypothetical protein